MTTLDTMFYLHHADYELARLALDLLVEELETTNGRRANTAQPGRLVHSFARRLAVDYWLAMDAVTVGEASGRLHVTRSTGDRRHGAKILAVEVA